MRWLDTAESWEWWGKCWRENLSRSGCHIGRSAHDCLLIRALYRFLECLSRCAAARRAHNPKRRHDLGAADTCHSQQQYHPCSFVQPTYALRLAEVAAQAGIDLRRESQVRVTIHAGEPGASLPATKQRIETCWGGGARAYDHAGATEVGAWGVMCEPQAGVHLNENEFICEVLDAETDNPAAEGELVITNLGRIGMPIIRYRTGDYVKHRASPCECGRDSRVLEGGVIGRLDNALIIRGLNVYPATLENIILKFPDVREFAGRVYGTETLDELEIQIESLNPHPADTAAACGRCYPRRFRLACCRESSATRNVTEV